MKEFWPKAGEFLKQSITRPLRAIVSAIFWLTIISFMSIICTAVFLLVMMVGIAFGLFFMIVTPLKILVHGEGVKVMINGKEINSVDDLNEIWNKKR